MILAATMILLAQAYPIPKVGQCPSGYRESGGYCSPLSDQSQRAIPKLKGQQCPSGWVQSGNACIEMRRRDR